MKKRLIKALVAASFVISGCATQENQQVILNNLAALTAARAENDAVRDDLLKAKGDPTTQMAIALGAAYRQPVKVQRLTTWRDYLRDVRDTALSVFPYFHHSKKGSDNQTISAGRDVILNSNKQDQLSAGMGINESVTRGNNNSQHDDFSESTEAVFAPEEGGEE